MKVLYLLNTRTAHQRRGMAASRANPPHACFPMQNYEHHVLLALRSQLADADYLPSQHHTHPSTRATAGHTMVLVQSWVSSVLSWVLRATAQAWQHIRWV